MGRALIAPGLVSGFVCCSVGGVCVCVCDLWCFRLGVVCVNVRVV